MKTNRRSFLARVAAIAAVAPLAGSVVPVKAEEEHDAEYEQIMAEHNRGLGTWSDVAQARADGYNRGREVEAARTESRMSGLRGLRPGEMHEATHVGGIVRGEMGSGSVVKG